MFKVGDIVKWTDAAGNAYPDEWYTVTRVYRNGDVKLTWKDHIDVIPSGSSRIPLEDMLRYAQKLSKLEKALK